MQILQIAMEELDNHKIQILEKSRVYTSPAWPEGNPSPDYLNMAILVETTKSPFKLLDIINDIEAKYGRKRDENNQWASRSLDIDIIDYAGLILNEEENGKSLILPHSRMIERDFVLLPLLDVCPKWVHPNTKVTAAIYLQQMTQNNQTLSAMPVA